MVRGPTAPTLRRSPRSCWTRRLVGTRPTDRPVREYSDDDLMVVGDDVTLADAFRQGGVSLLVALMAVAVVQSLDTAALGVMAPDIQDVTRCVERRARGHRGRGRRAVRHGGHPHRRAGRPPPADHDRRRLHPGLRPAVDRDRSSGQRVLAVRGAHGLGPRRVAHPAGPQLPAGRRLPDQGPRSDLLDLRARHAHRPAARTRHHRGRRRPRPAGSRAGGGPSSPSACRRWRCRSSWPLGASRPAG